MIARTLLNDSQVCVSEGPFRRLPLFTAIVICLCGLGLPQSVQADSAPASPALVADASVVITDKHDSGQIAENSAFFDFGVISPSSSPAIKHTFFIKNGGKAALIIDHLQPSCGCTTALIGDAQTLPLTLSPNQITSIEISINTAELVIGHVSKSVDVYAMGWKRPAATLYMIGHIQPSVVVTPSVLDFGNILSGKERSEILTVEWEPTVSSDTPSLVPASSSVGIVPIGNPFRIQQPNDPTRDRIKQRFIATFKSQGRVIGLLHSNVSVLFRQHPEVASAPDVTIPVRGFVIGSFRVSPSSINYGFVAPGNAVFQNLNIRCSKPFLKVPPTFTVRSGPYVSCKITKVSGGVDVKVFFSSKAPAGALDTIITVISSTGEVVNVPLSAFVATASTSVGG